MDKREIFKQKKAALDALMAKGEDNWTAEERTQFQTLTAECGKLKAEIAADEAKARNIEIVKNLDQPADPTPIGRGDLTPPADEKPKEPAIPKRHLPLKAFRDARDAYQAGQWFLGTWFNDEPARRYCREHGIESRAASTVLNTAGGYLVPDVMERAIIDLREQYGVFRRNARVLPMLGDVAIIPRRASGVTAYFPSENAEITASDKGWDGVEITCRKMAALCRYSAEIAADAIINIADDLANEIAYAFALKEDQCGFLGDATSTYGHISGLKTKCTAATATVYTAITGNTAFSTLDLADFEAMIGQLPQYASPRAKWYISKAGWAASMMRLADSAGGATYTELTSGARVPTFLGYPVEITQVMNSTLTAQTSAVGGVFFGDLAMAATIGERAGLTIEVSTDRYFEYDQLAIRGTQRIGINVHDVGNTSVAGAMIMLNFPGS